VLKAIGWPRGDRTVVVVGHQPTLGETAALLLTGGTLALSVRKGAIWWLARRPRDVATVLRAVMSPDLL
jgi:phosphohistidine phosphatase